MYLAAILVYYIFALLITDIYLRFGFFVYKNGGVMKGLFFLIILVSFLNVGCSGSAQVNTPDKTMLTKITEQKFSENNSILFNEDKTYALCLNNSKKQLTGPVSFFIYSLKSDKIILEDSIAQGSLKWLNDSQIEVKTIPGIVKGGEGENTAAHGYIFDLNLQQKLSINKANRLK